MKPKSPVTVEKIDFKGWPNSYRMTNGELELVVTGDVGPRVIRLGFVGGQNVFKEHAGEIGTSGEPTWRNRGGHRLWVGPEQPPDSPVTYAVDNSPVQIRVKQGTIEATAPVEPGSRLQKQIVLKMADAGGGVEVLHRITNHNPWTVELAAWGLTVMAPGGTGVTGLPPRGTHPEVLPPTNPLVIWAFTDLSDRRWKFTKKYIILKQDRKQPSPQKIGLFNRDTFGAYFLRGELFVKQYEADPGRTYPDMGASYETFANGEALELETLGPLERLAPGESLTHVERWRLFRDVTVTKWTDEELDRVLEPLRASGAPG
jgi:hypothetical protein